jgi:hypothetical protein
MHMQFGMTPLMKASARGHAGVVAILLTPGKREGAMKLKPKVREPAQVDLKNSVGAALLSVRLQSSSCSHLAAVLLSGLLFIGYVPHIHE